MMNNNRLQLILLAVSVFLTASALYIAKDIPADLTMLRTRQIHFDDSTTLVRLALINSAVKSVPPRKYFEYKGGFENPFKSRNAVRLSSRRGNSGTAAKAPRVKFLLKGILTKNKPLAILEDEMGETYIRGIGEKVLDQSIVSIADNRVTLRDRLGTYVLVVEEQ
jgi:hypothetical protein